MAETDPKGSVIPSLQTLGEETPIQPELTLVDHAGPVKVEVRRDLTNPEKYFYRPLFYLDIEKFDAELEVCEGIDASFEPQNFFLEFIFPNLSDRLADAIEMASPSGDKVRDTDVLGVANLGLEIRFKDIFDDQLIYQDISEDLLPAGPLPTFKLEAVNGRTCRDWYLLKKFLERGAERFEANVFVWSSDNTVPKTIDIAFKTDVLEEIENEIFGQANYSIVFDEDRGGSERKENSSSNNQTRRSSRTGPSYSVGASIPIGSFSIGGEASFSRGSSERDDSYSSSKSSNYENIKNRLTQTVSGSRILSRDYLTSFGLDSVSGFSIEAVNFSATEASDQIELCLKAREQALDYVPVRLELNDQNKAVLTTREFQEQIGMVDLQANDIQRLKAAGGLDLDVTVLDRTALREAMQCDFTYRDQESRPTGKWKLTYYPKQVADAWKEKQKAAQIDATVEELAGAKFAELQKRIDYIEASMNSFNTDADWDTSKYEDQIPRIIELNNPALPLMLEHVLENWKTLLLDVESAKNKILLFEKEITDLKYNDSVTEVKINEMRNGPKAYQDVNSFPQPILECLKKHVGSTPISTYYLRTKCDLISFSITYDLPCKYSSFNSNEIFKIFHTNSAYIITHYCSTSAQRLYLADNRGNRFVIIAR